MCLVVSSSCSTLTQSSQLGKNFVPISISWDNVCQGISRAVHSWGTASLFLLDGPNVKQHPRYVPLFLELGQPLFVFTKCKAVDPSQPRHLLCSETHFSSFLVTLHFVDESRPSKSSANDLALDRTLSKLLSVRLSSRKRFFTYSCATARGTYMLVVCSVGFDLMCNVSGFTSSFWSKNTS